MELFQWLTQTQPGGMAFTAIVSMLPMVELRGGIPFGVGSLGLTYWEAFLASVIGNMLPVPFLIVYLRRILQWLCRKFPALERMVAKLRQHAQVKSRLVQSYQCVGLFLLVMIPLPGTGAWTGSVVASLLDLRLRDALPAIFCGILAAGLLVLALTLGVSSALS